MISEFYGPKAEAEVKVNELLKLPATGKEQDWEYELADPKRIDEMFSVYKLKDLNVDCKCAIALLTISSMQEADELGILSETQIQQASELFVNNKIVLERMAFYWIKLGKASNLDLIKRILCVW
jgi:hypothetical protein